MRDLPRFAVGTTFKRRGKHPCLCTVVDILKTYNSKGALVRLRYVVIHEFMGQIVTEQDVCEATIAMGAEAPTTSEA